MTKERTPVRRKRPGAAASGNPFHPSNVPDIESGNIELLAEADRGRQKLGIVRTSRKLSAKSAQEFTLRSVRLLDISVNFLSHLPSDNLKNP